ncbi:MAG: hypothetical protein ABIP48_29970, partial [Planctomycetota bacterium]
MTAKRDSLTPGLSSGQVSRRDALKRGIFGSAGLLLAERLSLGAAAPDPAPSPAPEKTAESTPASAGPIRRRWPRC